MSSQSENHLAVKLPKMSGQELNVGVVDAADEQESVLDFGAEGEVDELGHEADDEQVEVETIDLTGDDDSVIVVDDDNVEVANNDVANLDDVAEADYLDDDNEVEIVDEVPAMPRFVEPGTEGQFGPRYELIFGRHDVVVIYCQLLKHPLFQVYSHPLTTSSAQHVSPRIQGSIME